MQNTYIVKYYSKTNQVIYFTVTAQTLTDARRIAEAQPNYGSYISAELKK